MRSAGGAPAPCRSDERATGVHDPSPPRLLEVRGEVLREDRVRQRRGAGENVFRIKLAAYARSFAASASARIPSTLAARMPNSPVARSPAAPRRTPSRNAAPSAT